MSRAIFLDFDGVLHDVDAGSIEYENGSMVITGTRLFQHVGVLEQLILPFPDVQLVIHSSWRNHYTLHELYARFPASLRNRIRGMTQPGTLRYAGILDYAEEHGISDYLILDDAPGEFCYSSDLPDELVICHELLGIGSPVVQEQIQNWLDGAGRAKEG